METTKLVVKEYLGTGKIAKLFGVAPRTVAKWIDNDMLHGTRIPGSRHRRVAIAEVQRFSKEHNMPFVEDDKPGDFQEEPLPPEQPQDENEPVPELMPEPDEPEAVLSAPAGDFLGRKEV